MQLEKNEMQLGQMYDSTRASFLSRSFDLSILMGTELYVVF